MAHFRRFFGSVVGAIPGVRYCAVAVGIAVAIAVGIAVAVALVPTTVAISIVGFLACRCQR